MPTEHIKTRQKLIDMSEMKTFEDLLARAKLSDDEKEFLRLRYVQEKSLMQIGEHFKYSERVAKRKHRKILNKIGKLL